MKKIAIFASGSGTNAENICKHFEKKKDIRVGLILTNKSDAFVIQRAKQFDLPVVIFNHEELKNGTVYLILKKYDIDFIVLAGFLLLMPENIVRHFSGKIVNIHPALLPKYGGKGMYGEYVHRKVIENKETESGITIHYVNEKYDEGAVIFQAKCVILENDSAAVLAEKIHMLEYKYYPEVIEKLIQEL